MKFIIMAANGHESSFELWLKKHGFKYTILNGMYKGQRETSFKINIVNDIGFSPLRNRAGFYSQETILIVENDNSAYLYYVKTSESQRLGTWKRVNKSIAVNSDAYSHDPSTDTYYFTS